MYKILTGFPKYMEYIESCKKKKSRKYVTIIHHPEIIGCQTQNKKTKTNTDNDIFHTCW